MGGGRTPTSQRRDVGHPDFAVGLSAESTPLKTKNGLNGPPVEGFNGHPACGDYYVLLRQEVGYR
jgi:hypothetical protein